MNPKTRLLEIHAAMPEQTRTIAGAVEELLQELPGGWLPSEVAVQIAKAAWQIGIMRERDDRQATLSRILKLESREAEAEPVAWMLHGYSQKFFCETKFMAEKHNAHGHTPATPLFRLKSPPSPTPPSVAGTSPEKSADGGSSTPEPTPK